VLIQDFSSEIGGNHLFPSGHLTFVTIRLCTESTRESSRPDPPPRADVDVTTEATARVGRASQKAKCPTDCHSVRFYGGGAARSEESRPLGKLGQALPRRQTRFLVAPLLGMTSSRKGRSCTLAV
jgi:hypothetical protein